MSTLLDPYRHAAAAGGLSIVDTAETNSSGDVTSLAVTLPSTGVINDDLFVLLMTYDDNIAPGTAPTGWTELYSQGSNTGNDREIAAYWRVRDGTEASTVTVSWTFQAQARGVCFAVRGADTTTPVSGSDFDYGSSTANPPGQNSSLTANNGDAIFWHLSVQSATATMSAVPAGSTEQTSATHGSEESTIAWEPLTGNPDTGDWTITTSTNAWMTGAVVVAAA